MPEIKGAWNVLGTTSIREPMPLPGFTTVSGTNEMEEIIPDKTKTMTEDSLQKSIEIDPAMPQSFSQIEPITATKLEAQHGDFCNPLKEQLAVCIYRNSQLNYKLGKTIGMMKAFELDKHYPYIRRWINSVEAEIDPLDPEED